MDATTIELVQWLRNEADLREKSTLFMDDDPELAEESQQDAVMMRAAAERLEVLQNEEVTHAKQG